MPVCRSIGAPLRLLTLALAGLSHGRPSDAACPPLVLRAGAAAWAPVPGAPDELGALERPALASVVLG